MKRMTKNILTLAICLLAVLAFNQTAYAKTYYNTKYGSKGNAISLSQKPVVSMTSFQNYSKIKYADFDKNGKRETVNLDWVDDGAAVFINQKDDGAGYIDMDDTVGAGFKTYKVGKNTFAVLTCYGENAGSQSKTNVYLWKNNKLKLLKSINGFNDFTTIGFRKGVLIVKDVRQLDKYQWSKTLKQKYKKYINRSNTSITKTVYKKYKYSGGKFKSIGSDTYYRIGRSYN